MDDNKMERKCSTTSILKRKSINQSEVNDSNCEGIPSRDVRRVSFASSNFVKPFASDPEKNTIWDNTYEEEVNHTDSTSETKGVLDAPSFSVLNFDDDEENKAPGPFFLFARKTTSAKYESVKAANIDECDKENYVPSVLLSSFVAEDSLHFNESVFKMQMHQSEMESTAVDGIKIQNKQRIVDFTCTVSESGRIPSVLSKIDKDITLKNTLQDMEFTDTSLKLPDFAHTSNVSLTKSLQQFEFQNELTSLSLNPVHNITTNASNTLQNIEITHIAPEVPDLLQQSDLFALNTRQQLENTLDSVENVSNSEMNRSRIDKGILEKDFNNSEVSMELTSDILSDDGKNTTLKYAKTFDMSIEPSCMLPKTDTKNAFTKTIDKLEDSLQRVRVVENTKAVVSVNELIHKSLNMDLTNCANLVSTNIDTTDNAVSNDPNGVLLTDKTKPNDIVDTSMQITCIHSETDKIVSNTVNDLVTDQTFSNMTNRDITSMQLSCVSSPIGRIFSDNTNDVLVKDTVSENSSDNADTNMQFTCIYPQTEETISHSTSDIVVTNKTSGVVNENIDTSMQFTCIFPQIGKIMSRNATDESVRDKTSGNINNKSLDQSMQMTCMYPQSEHIISNKVNDFAATDKVFSDRNNDIVDATMQFTCVFPETGGIVSKNANGESAAAKTCGNIDNEDLDQSMQMTCMYPQSEKIILNKVNDFSATYKVSSDINNDIVDASMQFTCVFPETERIISKNANGESAADKTCGNIDNENLDQSMQMTCMYPQSEKIILNKVNDFSATYKDSSDLNNDIVDASMQFTCVFPETGRIVAKNANGESATDKTCANIDNKNLDQSMQMTCMYPQSEKILSNKVNYIPTTDKISSDIINDSVDATMQFTCVFPESGRIISRNANDKSVSDKTAASVNNQHLDQTMQMTCIYPQSDKIMTNRVNDVSANDTCVFPQIGRAICSNENDNVLTEKISRNVTNKSINTNAHATKNILDTENIILNDYNSVPTNKNNIDNSSGAVKKTVNFEDSDMQFTNTIPNELLHRALEINKAKRKPDFDGTLCNMSVDTHNLEAMDFTCSLPSILPETETRKNVGLCVKDLKEGGVDKFGKHKLADDIKNVRNDQQLETVHGDINDAKYELVQKEQTACESYHVPKKKTKFGDELQFKSIHDNQQEYVSTDIEHKNEFLEVDKDCKTNSVDMGINCSKISKECNTVPKIISVSRNKFLKFCAQPTSAINKENKRNVSLVKGGSSSPNNSKIEDQYSEKAFERLPECNSDNNLNKATEIPRKFSPDDTTLTVCGSSSLKENITDSNNYITKIENTCEGGDTSSDIKNVAKNDKNFKQASNDVQPHIIVTRSRTKLLKVCQEPQSDLNKNGNRNKCSTTNKNTSVFNNSNQESDTINNSLIPVDMSLEIQNKESLFCRNSNNLNHKQETKSNQSSEVSSFEMIPDDNLKGHTVVDRKFSHNDTTLTVFESSLEKESTAYNDKQLTSKNNATKRTSKTGEPVFSFDICRSSTLVNRGHIKDDDDDSDMDSSTIPDTKKKKLRLSLPIDDEPSSFALMTRSSPSLEYPIFRPLFSLKTEEKTEDSSEIENKSSNSNNENYLKETSADPETSIFSTAASGNENLFLCNTSNPEDMVVDDECVQEEEKEEEQSSQMEASVTNQSPSDESIAIQKLLEDFLQCSKLQKIEVPKISTDLFQKLDECIKRVEQLSENCNFFREDIVDLEQLDAENFESYSTSRFSDGILSANSAEDTGLSDIDVAKSLEDRVKAAASRSDKYWEFVKADDEYYYFYTYYTAVPFKVKVDQGSEFVNEVQTYINLVEDAEPLLYYIAQFLNEKLKMGNLLLVLGGRFDLLTLLDYVCMCMQEVVDFTTEFNELKRTYGPTHKFRMDSYFNVIVEVLNIEHVIWWVTTLELSIFNLGSVNHIQASSIYEDFDEKHIQNLGKSSSGLSQLRNFIVNLDQYVHKVGKAISASRMSALLT